MTENQLEQECLAWLANVGWQHRHVPDIAPDGDAPERDNYLQVLQVARLRRGVELRCSALREAIMQSMSAISLITAARSGWRWRKPSA
ncbi:MAG: hypothetical protein U5L05_11325 [Rubrivivax sp.]|nr:hypothetical protein [Rubrivivax sp.]